MNKSLKNKIKKSPQGPGVYLFKNKTGEILYIGKAANLRNRLKQYLNRKSYSPFSEYLLGEAEKIKYKITDSEIEALILESQLIKKHRPKFNIMLRDNKEYFYAGFTNDEFPKISITHQPLFIKRGVTPMSVPHGAQIAIEHYGGEEGQDPEVRRYIGPFTDGTALKSTLRLLRKIFPYCTCKQKHNNLCLNYHIGKCLGYCCLKNEKTTKQEIENYKKNIKSMEGLLSGEKNSVIRKLGRELKKLGEEKLFEEAIELRNKIGKLEQILENAKILHDSSLEITLEADTGVLFKIEKIFRLSKTPCRIEGYDISNIQGKNATGAMVVFRDGQPDKNEYRKFKIIFKKTPDDTAMLKEILIRRLRHPEWAYPDLIFVDGGKGQLNAAITAIKNKFPAISLAKGKNKIFSSTLKKPIPLKKLLPEVQKLIRQIDSEAHRFAITYYRKLHRQATLK